MGVVRNAGTSAGAFETGFAVKWLVEAQINGDMALNFDPASAAPPPRPTPTPYRLFMPGMVADWEGDPDPGEGLRFYTPR